MLFIYLYHGDLYSDLWNCDLYFRRAVALATINVMVVMAGF